MRPERFYEAIQRLHGSVDIKPANDGSLLISDDYSGTIYRLAPLGGR